MLIDGWGGADAAHMSMTSGRFSITYLQEPLRKAVLAIEDEAARMERERIAAAVEALPWSVYDIGLDTILAAITDTGEEAAP